MKFIDISGVGQVIGQTNGFLITLVCYGFTDECIIIIGVTEVLFLFTLHGNILIESSIDGLPVAHGVGHDDFKSDGVTVIVFGTLALDNLNGAVEVLHGLLWLCVHLNIGQVHIDRCQIVDLSVVNLV